jgi:nitrosuccinate lyase
MPVHSPTRDRETGTDSGLLNPVRATGQAAAALSEQAWIAAMLETEDERAPGAWHTEWQLLREAPRLTEGAVVSERLNAVLAPLLGKADTKRILAARACRAATGEVTFAKALADHPELHGQPPAEAQQLLAPEEYLGAADEPVSRVLARPARVESA